MSDVVRTLRERLQAEDRKRRIRRKRLLGIVAGLGGIGVALVIGYVLHGG